MLQEKFQTIIPFKEGPKKASDGFVSFKSQRETIGNPQPKDGEKFNCMPPGYEAETKRDKFVRGFGGDTDVSGDNVNAKALCGLGYTRNKLAPDDDMYGGEHIDMFYSEVVDEAGNVGFVERCNYLDRL